MLNSPPRKEWQWKWWRWLHLLPMTASKSMHFVFPQPPPLLLHPSCPSPEPRSSQLCRGGSARPFLAVFAALALAQIRSHLAPRICIRASMPKGTLGEHPSISWRPLGPWEALGTLSSGLCRQGDTSVSLWQLLQPPEELKWDLGWLLSALFLIPLRGRKALWQERVESSTLRNDCRELVATKVLFSATVPTIGSTILSQKMPDTNRIFCE